MRLRVGARNDTRMNNHKLFGIMNNNQVFVDEIHMETQTVFHNNGNINIYPCEFELGQQIVAGDFVASQKGRMTTEADGRSHFRPYALDSGPRYTPLYNTPHGEVKTTKEKVIFHLAFPKRMDKEYFLAALSEEMNQMKAFVKTRQALLNW